jgi:hypothetical protein
VLGRLGFPPFDFSTSQTKGVPMFELVITVLLASLTGFGATAARILWAAAMIIPS